jgi:hypothetical protein
MTATQHEGTLRHWFLHYTTLKIMLVLFHSLIFYLFLNVVFLSFWLSIAIYRLQVATFSPLAWVAIGVPASWAWESVWNTATEQEFAKTQDFVSGSVKLYIILQ